MYLQYHIYLRTTVMGTTNYYTVNAVFFFNSTCISLLIILVWLCMWRIIKNLEPWTNTLTNTNCLFEWVTCVQPNILSEHFVSDSHIHTTKAVMILVMALLSRPEWRYLALGMSAPVFLLLLWQQNEEIWEKRGPPSHVTDMETQTSPHTHTHTHILNTSTVLL